MLEPEAAAHTMMLGSYEVAAPEVLFIAPAPPAECVGLQESTAPAIAGLFEDACKRASRADVPALRAWDRTYRKPQESSGLLPVANVYGDARLWANTEWAAWLLLDKSDFAV